MTIGLKYGVSGTFHLERRKVDTCELVERTGPCRNLVVASGLDMWMTIANIRLGAVVGTGNAPVLMSDRSLSNFRAGQSTPQGVPVISSQTTTAPYWNRKTMRWRFAQGQATGNISEVGAAYTTGANPTSGSTLYSRALVRDGSGNPTTITILPDEFLDVVYTHTTYCPPDNTGVCIFTIDGSPSEHAYVARCSQVGEVSWSGPSENNALGALIPLAAGSGFAYSAAFTGGISAAVSGLPSGTRSNADSMSSQGYTEGTFTRSFSFQFGLNSANFSIQSVLYFSHGPRVQVQYSPAIPKTSAHQMRFDFTVSVANYEGP